MPILDPYAPVGASTGGGGVEYGLNIQRGLVEGVGVVHLFGRNPNIDMGSGFEDIWNGGGEYTGMNAIVAETITISSSSTDDVFTTGTGAHLLELRGLDANLDPITEVIALNGTTPVTSTLAYLRCDTAIVLTAGSSGENQGTITGNQTTTTANVFFSIPPTSNRTLICAYTVPNGKLAYVTGGFATIASKGAASSEIKAKVRPPNSVFQTVEWFAINGTGNSYVDRDFEIPLIGVPAGTDIKISADSDTNNVGVAAGLEILVVDV